jgi:hypothetical protein
MSGGECYDDEYTLGGGLSTDTDDDGVVQIRPVKSQPAVKLNFVTSEDESEIVVKETPRPKEKSKSVNLKKLREKGGTGKVAKVKLIKFTAKKTKTAHEAEKDVDVKELTEIQRLNRASYRLQEAKSDVSRTLDKYKSATSCIYPVFSKLKESVLTQFHDMKHALDKKENELLAQLRVLEDQAMRELPRFMERNRKCLESVEKSQTLVEKLKDICYEDDLRLVCIENMAESTAEMAHSCTRFSALDVDLDFGKSSKVTGAFIKLK